MSTSVTAQYAEEIRQRARVHARVIGVFTPCTVTAWIGFDMILEPRQAELFASVRLASLVPLLPLLWLAWSSTWGRRRPELLIFLMVGVVQAQIGWMIGRASEAREAYLLGFTVVLFGSGCLLPGRVRTTGAVVAFSAAALAAGCALAPSSLPVADLVTAAFYVTTASVLALLGHAQRQRLSRDEFTARAGLEAERRKADELLAQLQRLSYEDAVSGLANRRHWDQALREACARSTRDGSPLAVMLVDLDHFKRVNDTCGHSGGDEALRRVAGVLQDAALSAGTADALAARLGGDELAVLLPGVTSGDAAVLAEQVRRAVTELRLLAHPHLALSVSVGVAAARGTSCVDGLLMRTADEALYRAKESRNAVEVAELALPEAAWVPAPRAADDAAPALRGAAADCR